MTDDDDDDDYDNDGGGGFEARDGYREHSQLLQNLDVLLIPWYLL